METPSFNKRSVYGVRNEWRAIYGAEGDEGSPGASVGVGQFDGNPRAEEGRTGPGDSERHVHSLDAQAEGSPDGDDRTPAGPERAAGQVPLLEAAGSRVQVGGIVRSDRSDRTPQISEGVPPGPSLAEAPAGVHAS